MLIKVDRLERLPDESDKDYEERAKKDNRVVGKVVAVYPDGIVAIKLKDESNENNLS